MKTKQTLAFVITLFTAATSQGWATDLAIHQSDGKVVLSWPVAALDDFYLQFTTNLSSPASWSNAADPLTNGPALVLTNSPAATCCYYRLQAWETLFNGTSTAAFRGYQQPGFPGTDQWLVTANGELMALANASPINIITTNQYHSYELRWEWKTASAGNSGVKYRVTETYSNPASSGPEYQLLDDPSYAWAANLESGAAYKLFAPTNKVLAPLGQWNQCRLILQANHVEHWLNGGKVLEYEINSPAWTTALAAAGSPYNVFGFGQGTGPGAGYILFQNSAGPVWFRNIKLRQLPAH